MAALALATTVITSAFYDFMKYLLTEAPQLKRDYYAKTLKESFKKVADHLRPSAWADMTLGESIQLRKRLIGCLQSPDIDRDKFLDILLEEGLSRKEAEKFYSEISEEFKAIVDKEAAENPEVFMKVILYECKNHGVTLKEITADLSALREELPALRLVLDASKDQLDRIERELAKIAQERRVVVPTIQSVLGKSDPKMSEGTFFRKEPAWVDFEEGFIFERKEVDEIIEKSKKCKVHLVSGEPAAGKSVVLKNVGFKLAKKNPHVYFIGLKKDSDKLRPYFEQILRVKEGQPVLIIDDAHLQLSACEGLVRELRSVKSKIKVLIGSRPIEGIICRSPRQSSEFEYLSKTSLHARDASKGIIELFLRRKHHVSKERIAKASKRLQEYGRDLWILSWALEAFDPESDSVKEERIYEKIRDSIRGMGGGAEDLLLSLSVFYQFEIPIDRSLLVEQIGLEEGLIRELIDQSEIIQIEHLGMRRSLSLAHSSIAELYLKTYQNYPSLGENVRKHFPSDGMEYGMFVWYMLESDPTLPLVIINCLTAGRKEGQKLLLKLLENEKIEDQIHKGIEKEKDLEKITNLMCSVGSGNREFRRKLGTCVLHKGFPDAIRPKLVSETDLDKISSFFIIARSLARERENDNYEVIASSLDHNLLLRKIEKEKDVGKINWCISSVEGFDDLGRILIHSLDLDDLSSKLQKEDDMSAVMLFIHTVTRLDEELGLDLVKRVDFSKVKREDLAVLYWLWDSSNLRLRQAIADSKPGIEEDVKFVRLVYSWREEARERRLRQRRQNRLERHKSGRKTLRSN